MTKLVQNDCFLHVHLLAGRLHRTCPRDHRPPGQVGSELSSSWWTCLSLFVFLSFLNIKTVSWKCDSNTLTNSPKSSKVYPAYWDILLNVLYIRAQLPHHCWFRKSRASSHLIFSSALRSRQWWGRATRRRGRSTSWTTSSTLAGAWSLTISSRW